MGMTACKSVWSAQGCEPAQRLEPGEEKVRAAANGGEGRQARDLPANRSLWNLEFERSVLSADDRVPLITEFVKVPIVDPDVLRELELADETCADHERRDTALLAIVGGALREIRTIGRPTPDHAPAVHVRRRIARVHAAHVGAQRHGITQWVLVLVVEIVAALWVGAECGIVLLGRECQRRTAAPAAHQLRSDELPLLVRLAVRAQEVTELTHVLLEPPIGHEAAVAGEDFRLRQRRIHTALIRVTENELARLERGSRTGRRLVTRALDHRLREPVAVVEMIVRVIEGRGRLEIERRERLHP